jgi:hypothetical protein
MKLGVVISLFLSLIMLLGLLPKPAQGDGSCCRRVARSSRFANCNVEYEWHYRWKYDCYGRRYKYWYKRKIVVCERTKVVPQYTTTYSPTIQPPAIVVPPPRIEIPAPTIIQPPTIRLGQTRVELAQAITEQRTTTERRTRTAPVLEERVAVEQRALLEQRALVEQLAQRVAALLANRQGPSSEQFSTSPPASKAEYQALLKKFKEALDACELREYALRKKMEEYEIQLGIKKAPRKEPKKNKKEEPNQEDNDEDGKGKTGLEQKAHKFISRNCLACHSAEAVQKKTANTDFVIDFAKLTRNKALYLEAKISSGDMPKQPLAKNKFGIADPSEREMQDLREWIQTLKK